MMGDPFEKRSTAISEDLQTDSVPVNSDVSNSLAMRDRLGITKEKSASNEKDNLQNLDDSSTTSSPEVSYSKGPNMPDAMNVGENSLNQSRNSNIHIKQKQKHRNGNQSQGLETTCNEAEQRPSSKSTCRKNGRGGSRPAEAIAADKTDDDLVKVVGNLGINQTEAHQESRKRPNYPPGSATSKPTLIAVAEFPQTAAVGPSSLHTPTQEIASPSINQPHHKCEEDQEHFDVLLLYSEDDSIHCDNFMEMAKRQRWKVITVADFPPNLPKLTAFNLASLNSSYTVLLLTANFLSDIWCENHYHTALVQSIEKPLKRFSVIPVICQQRCEVPPELGILTSVSSTAAKYENIMKKTINIKKRLEREKAARLDSTEQTPHVPISGEKPAIDAGNSSLDEIYRFKRPELNPSNSVSQVFHNDAVFRQICDSMDREHPLGQDHRGFAEKVGFGNQVIHTLNREKSPTAHILECYCLKQLSRNSTKEDILRSLHMIFEEMHRKDVAKMLEQEMKK